MPRRFSPALSVLLACLLLLGCKESSQAPARPAAVRPDTGSPGAASPGTTSPDDTPSAAISPDTIAPAPAPSDTAAPGPAEVVRRYYEAIEARDFRRAYGLWGDGGRSSGQTFEAFAAGFARTAHVEAEVGMPGRVEGAAGSRYVEVPVTIRATTVDGEPQRFEGTYTLRRAVVDGATPAQRRWHLYSAKIERTD